MDFLKENLPLIIFGLSVIGMIIKQRINGAKIEMKIIEMEKDLKQVQEQQEAQQRGQNKLFQILTEIKSEQAIEFKYIKETLARHENKI